MRLGLVAFLAISCLLGTNVVFAWSEVGHLAIANIAVKDLLRSGFPEVVEITKNMTLYGAQYTPNLTQTIEGTSLFADETRDHQDIHLYDEWHYASRPYNPQGIFIKPTPPIRDVVSTVKTIRNSFNVMKQGGKSRNLTAEKAFILRMLVHCVGDFHQPNHMGGLYSNEFPTGDMGGTQFNVTFDIPNPLNLTNVHEFWDYGAGLWPRFPVRPIPKDNMTYVEHLANEIMLNHTRADLKLDLGEKDINRWAQQVYDHIPETVYPQLLKNGRVITKSYQDKVYPIIIKQIALAGYRLADMLKMIFATQTEKFTKEELEIPQLGNTEQRMRFPIKPAEEPKKDGVMTFIHRRLRAIKNVLRNDITHNIEF